VAVPVLRTVGLPCEGVVELVAALHGAPGSGDGSANRAVDGWSRAEAKIEPCVTPCPREAGTSTAAQASRPAKRWCGELDA
jgi:hypothetical protein